MLNHYLYVDFLIYMTLLPRSSYLCPLINTLALLPDLHVCIICAFYYVVVGYITRTILVLGVFLRVCLKEDA